MKKQVKPKQPVDLNKVTVKFKRWNCRIELGAYNNGRLAFELISIKNDEPILVATVNVPEAILRKDEVIIKNYSENEGVLEVLVKAKIISEPIGYIKTGFASSPICRILNYQC